MNDAFWSAYLHMQLCKIVHGCRINRKIYHDVFMMRKMTASNYIIKESSK